MKIKTSELQGAALDWAVAKCEGAYNPSVDTDIDGTIRINYGGMYPEWSTDWAQGGPIIEREGLTVSRTDQKSYEGQLPWVAYRIEHLFEDEYEHEYQHGPTPLVAAMRCYVASRLGDEVEIPEGLQ